MTARPEGKVLSRHRPIRGLALLVFAPFLVITGLDAWFKWTSVEPVRPEWAKMASAGAFATVLTGLVVTQAVFGRRFVILGKNGIRFRLGGRSGFLAWGDIIEYEFVRSTNFVSTVVVDSFGDGFYRPRNTRFSKSGGGEHFEVRLRDRRSEIRIGSGFSDFRRLCETVVDRVDPLKLPAMARALESGTPLTFGSLTLSGGVLRTEELAIPLGELREISVLDGQVELSTDQGTFALGPVPNAYALQRLLR